MAGVEPARRELVRGDGLLWIRSATMEEPWGGRAYVLVDDALLYVTVTVIDPVTLNYLDTRDAAVALAENLAVRIGA